MLPDSARTAAPTSRPTPRRRAARANPSTPGEKAREDRSTVYIRIGSKPALVAAISFSVDHAFVEPGQARGSSRIDSKRLFHGAQHSLRGRFCPAPAEAA